jgi:flagellar basal body-associated protein FliL
MSESNTNKSQTTTKTAKKSNYKTWWIVGLATFLVFTVAGSVFYTMNQKASNSQDSSSQSKPAVPPIKDVKQFPANRRPVPKQSTPATQKPAINPYTGEKQ